MEDAEYILWAGTFPGANGKSFQSIAKRCMGNMARGNAKMDVFDPVLGNGCVTPTEKNITWHPIRTATTTALMLGIAQWMISNNAYNTEFLSFTTYESAYAGGYASFTNATHLVVVDEDHPSYRKFLRPAEAGLTEPTSNPGAAAGTATPAYYVVVDAATGDPSVHSQCNRGTLEYEGEINGIKVRSSFLLMKDAIFEHTMDEYAQITGVPIETIEDVAREFSSHGVKAAATSGFGGTALANGLSAVHAAGMLNYLIGSDQMVGGMMARRNGAKTTADGARYLLSKVTGASKVSNKNAIYLSRTNKAWETTDEYKNRIAAGESNPKPKLPWVYSGGSADNQALIGAVNAYPYQAKILVSWMTNTLQASSGAMRDVVIERLKDPEIIPLHIACDVIVGEHANLADYIVPDTNPFESFGVVTQEGHWKGKGNAVRWPAKKPETIEISGGRHASYEAFLIDVAKACGLSDFGEDAIPAVDGTLHPLNDACDFFLKGIANLAYDTDPVEDIAEADVRLQALDNVPEAWKKAVTQDEWPKVLNVMSRGGRFWPVEQSSGKAGRSAYAKKDQQFYVYSETKAARTNWSSGEHYSGTVRYEPELLADGTPQAEMFSEKEWPFRSTNYKPRFRSISFLSNSPIMRDLCAHNYLEINNEDAAQLGINDGDIIEITNPGGDVMKGEAMVRGGIAKGTFGVAHGYGHVAYGAQAVDIEGEDPRPGNPAIAAGIHLQTMLDPTVADIYPVVDPEAASPARSGNMYKIEKS